MSWNTRAVSMLDYGVGRTKRSAVPAGVRHVPELRSAWSGLQTQPRFLVLTKHWIDYSVWKHLNQTSAEYNSNRMSSPVSNSEPFENSVSPFAQRKHRTFRRAKGDNRTVISKTFLTATQHNTIPDTAEPRHPRMRHVSPFDFSRDRLPVSG